MSAVTKLFGRWSGRRGTSRVPQPVSTGVTARLLVLALLPLAVLAAGVTAGCGGGGELRIANPEGGTTIELEFPPGEEWMHPLPTISGGFRPYETSLEGCPDWVRLLFPDTRFPDRRILAGIAPAEASGKKYLCTYRVTEADPGFRPQRSVTYGLRLAVGSVDELTLGDPDDIDLSVGTFRSVPLGDAKGGIEPYTYSFICAGGQLPSGMSFAPSPPVLAGTPDARFRDSCTYTVTDSAQPTESFSRVVQVEVTGVSAQLLSLPVSVVPGNVLRLRVGERARITFQQATGGVPPYTYELECPDPAPGTFPAPSTLPPGLGFGPQTRVLSGTPEAAYRGPDCTYRATDSDTPPTTVAQSVALIIDSERAKWRFTERSLVQRDRPLNRNNDADPQLVHQLPVAEVEGGTPPQDTVPVYRLIVPRPLGFDPDPDARRLEYVHPESGNDPRLGRTSTFRYQVLFGSTVDDTLCIDVSFRDEDEDDADDRLVASVRIRDDAYFDGEAYRCPAAPLQPASASQASVSNPVHAALAPVHARRAVDIAHTAVRDRVRNWSRGNARSLTGIAPAVGLASLSGESGGFDYSGTSESLSAGAELGAGSWQAGVVASVAWTELHYRAGASLAELGYRSGEHDTEFLSMHPFAAWHASSGGHIWASVGAGTGELRHRDDLGFPSWSRSDARLLTSAVGGSLPLAELFHGELQAEAGIETFALEIEGGGRISSSLPTMRGRDYRAGLAWSAPLPGSPSMSMGYKHLTRVGADGGSLEVQGSFSVAEVFDPRLSLTGSVEASFGLGENDQNLWGLGVGLGFASDGLGRGFGLDIDTRLASRADERSPGVTVQGEAGYGLWGGPAVGTVRPYVGVIHYPGDRSFRQTLGLALRETRRSTVRIELNEHSGGGPRAIMLRLRHRP